jgi:PAS domain S-box-containing protein
MSKNTFLENNLTKKPKKSTGSLKYSAISKPSPANQAGRQAEEEIRTLKQQMEFILGVTKTGLDIIDSEFNIRYIDPEWAKVYGDPTGRKCFEYFMNRGKVCSDCGIPIALKTKSITVTEETLVKEGNRPIQVTTIPFQTSKGEWLVAEVNVDISERKRIEEVLHKAHGELEKRVQERTAELLSVVEALQDEMAERKRAEEILQRSEEVTKRLAQENAAMAEIGRIISSTLNIEEVYERFAEEVHKLIPFEGIAINIINHKDCTLTVPYVSGIAVPGCQPGDVFPLEGSVTGGVARTHSGVIIQTEDRKELQTRFPTLLTAFETGLRSVIAVPLISKDRVIGAIHFRSTKPNAYSDQNLKLAENIASQVAGAIANAQLFTEHKRTEVMLRQSEEKYRTILENIEDAYFEVDIAGNFTFFNDSVCRMLDYSKDELMGMNNQQYTDQENAKKMYQAFNRVFRTGEPTKGFDWVIIRKDGTKRYIETSVSLIKNLSGQPTGFRGIVRDITERRRAEETLRLSEEKYRTLVEESFDGIFIQKGPKIIFANQRLHEMLGYVNSELEGMDHWLVYHPDYQDLTRERARARMRGEKVPSQYEVKLQRKDGSSFDGEINARKIMFGNEPGIQVWVRDITERKRAEKALRESEERYRNILSNIEDGYYEVDIAGNFTFFNNSLCKILGYPEEEMLGMNNRVYMDKETERRVYQAYNQVYTTGEPLKAFGYKIIGKDGTERFLESHVSLLKNEKGERIGFRGIARDMTERKQAEEVLRKSEEEFRLTFENAKDAIVWADPEAGVIIKCNKEAETLLGKKKEEIIGSHQTTLHPPQKAEYYTNMFKRHIEHKGVADDEAEVITKSGKIKPVNITASLTLVGGKPIIQGIFRDITERKQAEEALRESEERYRTILENIEDGYYEVDLPGNFAFFNDSLCRMLGYSRDEMIGMGNQHYTDEENRKKLFQAFNEVYRTGKPAKGFDWEVIKKDGTKVFGEVSVSLIKDSKGQSIGFRGIARDITERKRSEQEMAALQEQLRQSQKMEAVGQLAGGIAHDFNNLLTIIKGYSQLSLLDLKENDPLWGNIQEIQKATQRATDLTRQLLAFSRRQILDLKVLDLNTLLKDLEKMLHRIIGEDIELTTLLTENLGRVRIDHGQFEQMILNLAVNARDAIPSGGKLTIETANVVLDEEYAHTHISVTPGAYVRLSVSDTGVGISLEVKEKVFEPFFTTKEKGKGTGLGLSTVYGIVKQSGGNIWVYSEPSYGTTFKIYLPRVEEDLDTLHGRDESDFLPRGGETVLLVEDEPSVRDLAHRLLNQQGYKVLEAANGEEALHVAQEHAGEKIHLLLTDVVMPRMGGKELADQLKILRPDIKVLYASGYTDNAIVHHGVLERGTHFLQKPFSPSGLVRKVREVLDR